jgi:hypothetical protein
MAFNTEIRKHHWSATKLTLHAGGHGTGAIHPEAYELLYLLAWLKTDATRHQASTNSRFMAQTPEQQRGALTARLRMELTLIILRASGTHLAAKHWATPLTTSLRRPVGRVCADDT